MSSGRRYRAPKITDAYATLQRDLGRAKEDAEFYRGEHIKTLRRAIDAEQRAVLLSDITRLQRETIDRLERRVTTAIRADEQPAEYLKLQA